MQVGHYLELALYVLFIDSSDVATGIKAPYAWAICEWFEYLTAGIKCY